MRCRIRMAPFSPPLPAPPNRPSRHLLPRNSRFHGIRGLTRRVYNADASAGGDTTLYFAYTSMIAPDRIGEIAPGATFRFIAHLPETKLIFPETNGKWDGALPSVRPEPGNTVWGAVFEISEAALEAIDGAEAEEGRVRTEMSAMDRSGHRYEVVTHVLPEDRDGELQPSREYMAIVVRGSRHWELPTGWVAGLQEYVDGDGLW